MRTSLLLCYRAAVVSALLLRSCSYHVYCLNLLRRSVDDEDNGYGHRVGWVDCRRLLGLEPSAQEHVFDLFQAVLDATVKAAKQDGSYDDGIDDVIGTSVVLKGPPTVVRQVRAVPSDIAACTWCYASRALFRLHN